MEGDAEKKNHNGERHHKPFKVAAAKRVTEQGYTPRRRRAPWAYPVNTLQYWVKVYGQRPMEQAETVETLRLRVRELERQTQRLLMEKEILKRATAFFAREQT